MRRLWLVPVFLGSCTYLPSVGPDYAGPPNLTLPSRFLAAPLEESAREQIAWWKDFHDPVLDQLLLLAITNNQDLNAAKSRVREARSQRIIAESGYYPQLSVGAGYTRSRQSENLLRRGIITGVGAASTASSSLERDIFQAGFDATWEVDIFGGIRRDVESAAALEEASQEDLNDVLVSLISEVARNYFEVLSLEKRLAITKKNAEAQAESLKIVEDRFNAGLTSELDLAQAKAQLHTTTAQIPVFETSVVASRDALATLLGSTELDSVLQRGNVRGESVLCADVPERVLAGTPADLLRNRPDIRRAEREVKAANAQIGAAIAEEFPKLTLDGSLGLSSLRFDKLFEGKSRTFSAGPGLNLPLFTGGRLSAQVDIQRERDQQAVLAYEKTVLNALREADTSLASLRNEHDRFRELDEAYQSSKRALDLSNELYRQGVADFLRVLDSERATFAAEDSRAQSEFTLIADLISAYKSLGLGWQHDLQSTSQSQSQSPSNSSPPS